MPPPPFRPVVQQGDLAVVAQAHAEMWAAKGVVYKLHDQLLRVAGTANSTKLKDKARTWLEHSDMLVSTAFDITHFNAQIKDRANRGLFAQVVELQAILDQVTARHSAALAALGGAEDDMEEAYVELVPSGNQGRTREKLRDVFANGVRGPGRPKTLPKERGPPNYRVEVPVDADFGGPQRGRKMTLTTRRGRPPGGGGPQERLVAVDFVADVKLGGPPGRPGHPLTVR